MSENKKPSNSLKIAKFFGIEVYVHWTFLFLVALVILVDQTGGVHGIVNGLIWIVVIFASVLIHELAHCVVAVRDGVVVDDILLLPIGGVSQMESIPRVPREELAIAIVGPLTSLGLAVLFGILTLVSGAHLWPPTLLAGSWLARIAWLNLLLGAFNLLPALPMDGGRVLRAGLAMREPRSAATEQAARIARFLAFVMIVVGLVWDVWLVFIGLFVMLGAGAEEREDQSTDSD